MNASDDLVLRADAGTGIGNGHVMRCLALAEAWLARGGGATLFSRSIPDQLADRVRAAGCEVEVLREDDEFVDRIAQVGPRWVALDSYAYPRALQDDLRRLGRLLVIDDFGSVGSHSADLIVDQNADAMLADYADRSDDSILLAGPRYVLLRHEFWAVRPREHADETVRNVIVSLGGAPSPQHIAFFDRVITSAGLDSVTSYLHRSPVDDMARVLADADMAVTAAGSTAYEFCAAGVPALLLPIADNQKRVVVGLARAGAAIELSAHESVAVRQVASLAASPAARTAMITVGRSLVDGRGSRRVLAAMAGTDLSLRAVEAGDARLLFEWANDPAVRAASFVSSAIEWDEHVAWLGSRLANPDSRMFVAADASGPIGLFRADRRGRRAEVGVSVAAERRGEGMAPAVIWAGTELLRRDGFVDELDAYIKPTNDASVAAFSDAAYDYIGTDDGRGPGVLHYAARATRREATYG